MDEAKRQLIKLLMQEIERQISEMPLEQQSYMAGVIQGWGLDMEHRILDKRCEAIG